METKQQEQQRFVKIVGVGKCMKRQVVLGTSVKLAEDLKNHFFVTKDVKMYYVIEEMTGASVAMSVLSPQDAIKKANKAIRNAKQNGVYYKNFFFTSKALAYQDITTPVNVISNRIALATSNVPNGTPESLAGVGLLQLKN